MSTYRSWDSWAAVEAEERAAVAAERVESV